MIPFFTDLQAAVEKGGRVVVRSHDGLNLRAEPSARPEVQVVASMPDGAAFALTGQGRLGLVEGATADGRRGWVLEEFLTAPGGFLGAGAVTTVNADGAELRAEPSLEAPVLAALPGGTTVTLTGSSRLGYVEGDFDGQRGWAFAEFLVAFGGTLPLAAIWGQVNAPLTQEHGRTPFSLGDGIGFYEYSLHYCRDWCADDNSAAGCRNEFPRDGGIGHPGLDVGVPFGTPLFTPVAGRVICAGTGDVGEPNFSPGCAAFPCVPASGHARSGRFELELGNGDRLLLGHLARVTVQPGQHLAPGDPIGLSGRDNGDHVHIEYRQRAIGVCRADVPVRLVDPRTMFP